MMANLALLKKSLGILLSKDVTVYLSQSVLRFNLTKSTRCLMESEFGFVEMEFPISTFKISRMTWTSLMKPKMSWGQFFFNQLHASMYPLKPNAPNLIDSLSVNNFMDLMSSSIFSIRLTEKARLLLEFETKFGILLLAGVGAFYNPTRRFCKFWIAVDIATKVLLFKSCFAERV